MYSMGLKIRNNLIRTKELRYQVKKLGLRNRNQRRTVYEVLYLELPGTLKVLASQ